MAYRCLYCKARFDDDNDLRAHKFLAMAEENPTIQHLFCTLCEKDYHSAKALTLHRRQYHPHEQKLDCPGCDKRFHRVGELLGHIERKECRITINNIIQRRHDMAEFNKKLDALKGLSTSVVHQDLARYMVDSTDRNAKFYSDADAVKALTSFKTIEEQKSAHNTIGDDKQPAKTINQASAPLIDRGSNLFENESMSPAVNTSTNAPSHNPSLESIDDIVTFSPTGADTKFAHNAKPPLKEEIVHNNSLAHTPTRDMNEGGWIDNAKGALTEENDNNKTALLQKNTNDECEIVCHHPDDPTFDVNRYWSDHMQQYACPISPCWRYFDTDSGLKNHLRNDHNDPKYACPGCLHQFKSATALLQHLESTNRCLIRESHHYRALLDQLTGGIADTDGYHKDETVKYVVQPFAKTHFTAPPEAPPNNITENAEEDIDPWMIMDWADKKFKAMDSANGSESTTIWD